MKQIIVGILLIVIAAPAWAKDYKTRLDSFVSDNDVSRVVPVLKRAKKGDVVYLNVTSPGGEFYAGEEIRKAIRISKGTVVGVVNGTAASEAAFILIKCTKIQGSGQVMFHMGPGNTPYDGSGGQDACRVTKPFLTKSEHRALRNGADVWLSVSVLKARLGK